MAVTSKQRPPVADPAPDRQPRGRTVGVLTLVLLLAAGVGWWLLLRGGGESAAVEQAIRDAIAAENAGDGERFVTFFTDDGLASYDVGTREEILAGDVPLGQDKVEIDGFPSVTVDGDSAAVILHAAIPPVLYELGYDLVREDGEWRINEFEFIGGAPAPAGTTMVDVDLDEFEFVFDASAMATGDVGIAYRNIGEQPHHLVLIRFTEPGLTLDGLLDRAMNSDEGDPEGMEHVGFLGFAEPGGEGTVAFTEPLETGRYAFLCFLPDITDSEETPHAFRGMAAEFAVE